MNLEDLFEKASPKEKENRRLGRGNGSGKGTYCGRGIKGQKARSGYSKKAFFAGGQTPILFRFPKQGFNNKDFQSRPDIINVFQLNRFDEGTEITPELLEEEGLVDDISDGVKVLGDGELEKSLQVKASSFSQSAREKIDEAGGEAIQLESSDQN